MSTVIRRDILAQQPLPNRLALPLHLAEHEAKNIGYFLGLKLLKNDQLSTIDIQPISPYLDEPTLTIANHIVSRLS